MTFEQCILSAPWILECVVTKQRRASGWQRTRIGRELLGGRDWGATSVIALCRRHFLLVTQCSRPLGCFLTLPIWWSTRYGWSAGLDARRANRDGAEDEGRLPRWLAAWRPNSSSSTTLVPWSAIGGRGHPAAQLPRNPIRAGVNSQRRSADGTDERACIEENEPTVHRPVGISVLLRRKRRRRPR